jgi:alpha/beta superfamily hydrolase
MEMPTGTKPFVWGAAVGAVAAMIVGFSWGGWVTNGTAQALARDTADTAVVAALVPNCVKDFQQNANAVGNLVALKKITSSWERAVSWRKAAGQRDPGRRLPITSSLEPAPIS